MKTTYRIGLLFLIVFLFLTCKTESYPEPKAMMSLPPMVEQFQEKFGADFLLGNIATGSDYSSGNITNQRLLRHYNVLTAENNMKPSYYSSSVNTTTGAVSITNWNNADNFVNAATNSGFKIVGHTLLWHSQIPTWQQNMASASKDVALAAMKDWITQVVTRYKGKIYSWDILNEIFPDGSSSTNWKTSMRSNNPWNAAIGSDFVYEGFKAARLADPDAILYYNDYNLNNSGKATLVRNMVRDVNDQWKTDASYDDRLLIEGIGMQSHHNTSVTVSSIRDSLNMFKALGVKISISELDVLSQTYSEYSAGGGADGTNKTGSSTATSAGKSAAANLYGEYIKLFLANKDIIERITFWGVYDEQSWRSKGLPLIFEGSVNTMTKPAYYRIMKALGFEVED